jgi:hypothetical protein
MSTYYDSIHRECAAAGDVALARAAKKPAQTHCRTCGRDRCSCSDFAWKGRA